MDVTTEGCVPEGCCHGYWGPEEDYENNRSGSDRTHRIITAELTSSVKTLKIFSFKNWFLVCTYVPEILTRVAPWLAFLGHGKPEMQFCPVFTI
jgi:hypothetical protein